MQKKEFYFNDEDNFIWVARQFFPTSLLRLIREETLQKREQFQPQTDRDREAIRIGVAPDKIRLNPDFFKLWQEVDMSFIWQYLPEFTQITYPPVHRIITKEEHFTGWHQDIAYIRALGDKAHFRMINCWVPLDDKPSTVPSVQFSTRTVSEILPHIKKENMMNDRYIDPNYVPKDSHLVDYELNFGDVCFFGQKVPHRSFFEGKGFESRSSFEFRLTTADTRIDGKDYYDLDKREFYLFKK